MTILLMRLLRKTRGYGVVMVRQRNRRYSITPAQRCIEVAAAAVLQNIDASGQVARIPVVYNK
jgi:hypothetical protein